MEPIKLEWCLNTYGPVFEIRATSLNECVKNQQSSHRQRQNVHLIRRLLRIHGAMKYAALSET